MKRMLLVFSGIFAASAAQLCLAQQTDNGTFSTPAFNGTGADTSRRTTSPFGTTGTGGTRSNANFGTSLGRNFATNLGTTVATNSGAIIGAPAAGIGRQGGTTVMTPGSTAISPAEATNAVRPLGVGTAIPPLDATNTVGLPNSSVGIGQQRTTAIGQQGTVGIGQPTTTVPGQQGTTAIGQQGTVGVGQQNMTALGQQGTATAITPRTNGFIVNPDGTVTGIAAPAQGGASESALGATNSGRSFGTNRFGTNRFGTRTNQFRR